MGSFELINEACLAEWGQALVHTPAATPEAHQDVTGILDRGVEPEDKPPGDGSTYASLFLRAAAVNPAPVLGDEIATGSTAYVVVRIVEDAGGGMTILLRKDRDL